MLIQKRPMYECIQVRSYHEHDSVLNEEGDLDNESDDSDFEMEMLNRKMKTMRNRESGSSTSSGTSMAVRHGSPMSLD
jgi:hypothetical protein